MHFHICDNEISTYTHKAAELTVINPTNNCALKKERISSELYKHAHKI